jgi:hypothetical protein
MMETVITKVGMTLECVKNVVDGQGSTGLCGGPITARRSAVEARYANEREEWKQSMDISLQWCSEARHAQ